MPLVIEENFTAVLLEQLREVQNEYPALVKEIRVSDGAEERAAEQLFCDPKIRYANVRSTEAGCFLFRLERG